MKSAKTLIKIFIPFYLVISAIRDMANLRKLGKLSIIELERVPELIPELGQVSVLGWNQL